MFYDKMKAKYKKKFTERMHFFILWNYLLSRFKWSGLPDNIPESYLEGFLIMCGTVGMGKASDGNLWAFPGGYGGNVNGYLPENYRGQLVNVGEFEGKAGEEIAVGWNNATRMPEFYVMQAASILTEIDISEHVNVIFSRFIRVPKVHDNKEKDALTRTIQNILDGKIDAFVSDNVMKHDVQRILGGENESDFLELTDIKEIDKLQYLNQYRDNIMKRFWSLYGQSTQVTSKLAQMSPDEIHANDTTNIIYLLQCLEYRKRFAEECNRIFGTNISVELSEAFRREAEEKEGETNEAETVSNEGDSRSAAE